MPEFSGKFDTHFGHPGINEEKEKPCAACRKHFYDNQGNLIAFDPSVRTPGPGALLINRDVFLKFLNDNDYDLLWIILGEKNIIGSRLSPEDWKGRLELTRIYRIHQHNLEGVVNAKFISREG